MEPSLKNTAIYCRVAYQDEKRAMDQAERLRRFAEKRSMPSPTLYMDNGHSGVNFDRPALAKSEADIRDGHIQTMITLDVARIGRDFIQTQRWIDRMRAMGVKLVIVDLPDGDCLESAQHPFSDVFNSMYSRYGLSRRKNLAST